MVVADFTDLDRCNLAETIMHFSRHTFILLSSCTFSFKRDIFQIRYRELSLLDDTLEKLKLYCPAVFLKENIPEIPIGYEIFMYCECVSAGSS